MCGTAGVERKGGVGVVDCAERALFQNRPKTSWIFLYFMEF